MTSTARNIRSGVSASLYLDGNLLASEPTAITLADIDDQNNWIGRSKYDNPYYIGEFTEFRIYNVALDSCQLKKVGFDEIGRAHV